MSNNSDARIPANREITGDPAAPDAAPTTQGWLDSQPSLSIGPPAQASSATSQQAAEIPTPDSSQPQLHTSPALTLTDEVNPETHRGITRTLAQAGAIRRLLGDFDFEKRIFNFLLVELLDSYAEAVGLIDWHYNIFWRYYPDDGTYRTRSLRNVGEAIGRISYVSWDVGEARLRDRISVLETLFDDMADRDKIVFAQENAMRLLQGAMMQQRRQRSPGSGSDSDGESDGSGNGIGNGHWGTNGSANGNGFGILGLLGLPSG